MFERKGHLLGQDHTVSMGGPYSGIIEDYSEKLRSIPLQCLQSQGIDIVPLSR